MLLYLFTGQCIELTTAALNCIQQTFSLITYSIEAVPASKYPNMKFISTNEFH